MILNRSFGADLAIRVEQAAKMSDPAVADREIKELLSAGMSRGGLYFRNSFPKDAHFDAVRPDVRKVITNLMRANHHNWHGYLRELKLINELAQPDSHFVLEESGGRRVIKDGRLVEFDLLARHRASGFKIAIESKDWKIRGNADMEKAKNQIEKIAARARQQGVSRVIWVNRKSVHSRYRDELAANAKRRRVGFYDNISTSLKRPHDLMNPRRFDDVMETESASLRRMRGAGLLGKGVVALTVIYEVGNGANTFHKWRSGRITTRECISTGSGTAGGLAGGLAGGYAGAEAGAFTGSFFGPGPGTAAGAVVGGLVGSAGGAIAGALAGELVGTVAAEKLMFQSLEQLEVLETIEVLKDYYQQISQ